jgi:acetoin utilization deacetylase AcuC-like enzyme
VATGRADDSLFDRHQTGSGHPESPARLTAVRAALDSLPLEVIPARDATAAELERAHDRAYLHFVQEQVANGASSLDADTVICPDSWKAAVRAAGAGLALGEAWLAGEIEHGFACVRPPGHHAERRRAMGFCLLGNIAVLAHFLRERGKRVAIVDWDVHHGNGTQDIFRDVEDVGFLSLHQWPLWPGTGRESERGAGNIRNICMPPGSGDEDYLRAFDEVVLPWLDDRKPDVILVSAGFDAHAADPLANQRVSSAGFGEFTRRLLSRGLPILSLLEGGYDLRALQESVRAHVSALVSS